VYANVGNHDCVYGDYTFLPQQPLGVLYESGTFRRLYDEHELLLEADGVKVRVVGVPYHGTRYDLARLARIHRRDEDYLLVVAHLLASPKPCSMFDSEDVLLYDQLDAYPVDGWFFGHWHKDQGVTKTPGGKTVVNIGSLTRGSLAQDDLDRVPSVAVVRCTRRSMVVEKRPLRHLPANVAFDLERRDASLLREAVMEDHVNAVNEALKGSVSKGDLRDDIRSMEGVNPRVREAAIMYLEKSDERS
jgi:DNA repair exonuclease SbcCD nuclease subunit